jgi:hypothetical protein
MSKTQTWTLTRPRIDGWYWYKHPELECTIVYVQGSEVWGVELDLPAPLGLFSYYWYGPITPPELMEGME